MANPGTTTSAKSWKKRTGGVDLELPSGNIAKVKRPGMEKLLAAGVIPDQLTPIAMEAVNKGKGPTPQKSEEEVLQEFLKDQSAMASIFSAFDKVTAMCVVEPKVRLHQYTAQDALRDAIPTGYNVGDEIPEEEREEDLLYTDDVDMEDKTFIFQFVVGGDADLEKFRREHSSGVADLQSSEDVELPSQ